MNEPRLERTASVISIRDGDSSRRATVYFDPKRMNTFKLAFSGILAAVLFGVIVPALVSPHALISSAGLERLQTISSFAVQSSPTVSPDAGSRTPSPTTSSLKVPSHTTSSTQAALPRQLRGLWVDAFGPGFKTPAEADQLVRDARALNINALFVQVGRRGDCYCNRAAMPRSADPALAPNFDPLEYVISAAHEAGIQVHAWIITTAVWNVKFPVGGKNHVFRAHGNRALGRGDWLTQRVTGERQAGVDYLLDPGHPDAAEFIAQEYLSVVKKYAVDGIMFDRVRYPDSGDQGFQPVWGYNPTALERFRAATSRTGKPTPTDPQWMQWRRDQVTNLVRRVSLEAKTIRPELWVSAATITYREPPATLDAFARTRTYSEVLQDWPGWTAEGIIDLNVPMNYKRERQQPDAAWFDGWNGFAVLTRGNAQVAIGAAIYLNTLPESLAQLRRALKLQGAAGWVGYSYRTPDVNVFGSSRSTAEGLKRLTASLTAKGAPFEKPARWGSAPTDHLNGLLGRVTRGGQGRSDLSLALSSASGEERTIQTDANGYYGASDLPVGTVTVSLQDDPATATTLEIAPGGVARAPDLQMP